MVCKVKFHTKHYERFTHVEFSVMFIISRLIIAIIGSNNSNERVTIQLLLLIF